MNTTKIYEEFHKNSTAQLKIINERNFTYRNIAKILNTYISPSKQILDIGCGAGTISLMLASRGNRVLGIDISNKAIKECNQSARYLALDSVLTFKKMDFPYETPMGKFDIAICFEVIEHLKDDRLALKKIFTLLNKGGIAIISTPSIHAPVYRLGLANKFDKRVGHLRRYTIDQLIDMSEDNGFQVINTFKTEGIIRNFLFINPIAGKMLIFVRSFIADIVTFLDNIALRLFGESDLFIVLKKP